jgi:hypothetical protein
MPITAPSRTAGYARCVCASPKEGRERVASGETGVDRLHAAGHDLVDVMPLQRIDAIFAIDVIAAPRDLLRHDRALHDDGCETVGD